MSFGSSYPIKPIGQFAEVKGGKRLPAGHNFSSEKTAFPYIRAQDVGGGRIASPAMHIENSTFELLQRYTVETGDVCLTIAGNIGDIGYVNEELNGVNLTENAVKLTKLQGVDARFLTYALQITEVQAEMKGAAAGAAQPKLGIYKVKGVMIPVPTDISVQHSISTILFHYDALIETNRSRIVLLEESARLLYREWFIKLRFPGYDLVNVVDGLPDGWSRKILADLAILNYGKALKAEVRKDGDIPVYGSSGIVGFHNVSLINSPCIIIGRKGNVGSVFFSHIPCFGIDTVYYVNSEQTTYYLMLVLQNLNFISSDAAVPGLNRNYAYSLPIIVPDEATATAFEELLAPVFEQINALEKANKKASEARDALLPKLMSGQLAV